MDLSAGGGVDKRKRGWWELISSRARKGTKEREWADEQAVDCELFSKEDVCGAFRDSRQKPPGQSSMGVKASGESIA